MNENNMNSGLSSASTNISSQYSQFGGFLSSLDENLARNEGKKLGKALTDGLKQAIDTGILDSVRKQLTDISQSFEATLKSQNNSKEAAKIYNQYIKESNQLLSKTSVLQAAIESENGKAVHSQDKVLELNKQLVEYLERANFLNDTAALQQEAINLKKKEEEAIEERLRLIEEGRNKETDERIKKLNEEVTAYRDKRDIIDKEIAAITVNSKELNESLNKTFDDMNNKNEKVKKGLKETLSGIRDTATTLQSSFNSVVDAFNNTDNAISRWNTGIDNYTSRSIQMGNRWGTGYSTSGDFNEMKNAFVDALSEDEVGYSLEQIYSAMDDLAGFSFDSKEIAIDMASDLAFAKEYMGQSSESLRSMYALQVRTGQDDFVKRSLNTIAALQRTGNALAQEQVDAVSQQSMTLTEKLMDMGMSSDVADETYNGMMAYATAVEQATGRTGDAQKILDMFESSLDLDNLGLMVSSPQAYLNALNSGQFGEAMNMLATGPSASAANANRSDGLTLGGIVMGNENVFGGYDNNFLRRITESGTQSQIQTNYQENLSAIAANPNAMEDMKNAVSDAIPEDIKKMQEKAQELIETDWGMIANQLAFKDMVNAHLNTIINRLDGVLGIINILAAGLNIVSSLKNILPSGAGSKIISGGKNILGKVVGGGKNFITALGSKGTSTLAGTTAGNVLAGAGVVGGAIATGVSIYDGISVGTQGFRDSEGNRIEGTEGFGNGLAAAVTNQDLYASTGKDVGSGALKGAGIGAMIGTFVGGPVGTIVGGAIGTGIGALAGLLGHNRKEEAKEQAALLAEQKKQTELAQATAANTEAIKNARDVALSNRYDDNRYGYDTATVVTAGGAGALNSGAKSISSTGGMGASYPWTVTSDYGNRVLSNGDDSFHNGMDFGIPIGTPIGSPISGTVIKHQIDPNNTYPNGSKSGGTWVYIQGDDGIVYGFGHLSDLGVKTGDRVLAGQQIALSGNTGYSTGPHLHFSTKQNGNYVDPAPFITQGLFTPSGGTYESVTNGSSSSNNMSPYMSSREAEAYSISWIPDFRTSVGDVQANTPTIIESPSIIRGLQQINDTLLAIEKRQNDQQRILDALTNTPIQNLGV